MAANDLASNPLYDTEDNDDDDRRLATTSFMPRTRKEPGQGPAKKKASGGGGGAKLFGSTGGGIKLNGGKMFGNFDVGAMVGADELEFNHQKSNYEHTGMIDESEFVIDALTERRKKEMIWNSSPVPRHRENLEKKSIEKHEEMVLKENEAKFLNGILNQALVFDEKEEIEIVITNDNKPTQANPTQPNGTQQITSRFSSKVYGGSSHISGGTSVLESQLQLQRQQKNTESGVFQFKSQFSQSILGLKRGSKLEDIPIRDRNDLKKVLTKSVFERRKLATEEEVLRSTKISDFCQKNDQDDGDQSSRSESGNPMDIERAGSKLATSEMVALEEEGYDEDAEGSIHEDEEGYDEVRKEIERVEQLVLSDDEEGDQNAIEESQDADQDGVSAKNSGMQKIKNQVEDSDSEDEGSNYLDDEADEEEDDASQSNEGSQSLNGNGIEAEEDTNPQPAMRRLKKVRDVKAAKKAEKRERRDIRRAQFYQIEKEKRKAFKTNDIYDDEADLGEIVDGKDAGLKNINRENPEENDDDASSANLEELIDDIVEFDGENESLAFRHHINELLEDDRALLKKVVKGSFKDSIKIRTDDDRRKTAEFRQQRLEFIKKQIDDVNKFQSAFKTKEDKYRRLLGVDQEELEAEKNMLESSMNKNDNSDAKKAAEKKESTDEKNRKKNILNRLKISDVSNTAHNGQRKLFFDSSISKNEHLMKTLDSFDVNKKTQLNTNQIFMFRKKNKQTE